MHTYPFCARYSMNFVYLSLCSFIPCASCIIPFISVSGIVSKHSSTRLSIFDFKFIFCVFIFSPLFWPLGPLGSVLFGPIFLIWDGSFSEKCSFRTSFFWNIIYYFCFIVNNSVHKKHRCYSCAFCCSHFSSRWVFF